MKRWNLGSGIGLLWWMVVLAPIRAQGVSFAATPTIVSSGVAVNSPAGTSNITITSVNLPSSLQAGAVTGFGTHAAGWRIVVYGHVANNANPKSVVVRVAGVTLDSVPVTVSVANTWVIQCVVTFRTAGPGAGAQAYFCTGDQGPGTETSTVNNPPASTVSFDPTIVQALAVIAAIQTSAADIVLDGYFAELIQ